MPTCFKTATLLTLVATPVLADLPPLVCQGTGPNWTLTLSEDAAQFQFLDQNSDMSLMQSSVAEGQETPTAMTLVGPRDSAILIVQERRCNTAPFEANVLTQRGDAPILLTGCCVAKG